MIKLNNPYQSYYYLLEDGRIYDSKNNEYVEADKEHKFKLFDIDNHKKTVSLKPLYKSVYGKNFCIDTV